jgi:hypothetical protein
MNLTNHSVDTSPGVSTTIAAGIDFQAHQCQDNRSYLMNLSRAAPPDLPTPNTNEILTHQLRPEFVQSYENSLSADAFRADIGGSPSATRDNEGCIEASMHLRQVVVPQFAAELDSLACSPLGSAELAEAMHARGINVRYIGKLYVVGSEATKCELALTLPSQLRVGGAAARQVSAAGGGRGQDGEAHLGAGVEDRHEEGKGGDGRGRGEGQVRAARCASGAGKAVGGGPPSSPRRRKRASGTNVGGGLPTSPAPSLLLTTRTRFAGPATRTSRSTTRTCGRPSTGGCWTS